MRYRTPTGTKHARQLRRRLTDAERALWYHIKDRRLYGLKFRRQHPIGRYVADFACLEASLVVEVDGGQHDSSGRDAVRDDALRAAGFRVLRFWNNQVLGEIAGVLETIGAAARAPHPTLSPQAGRGGHDSGSRRQNA